MDKAQRSHLKKNKEIYEFTTSDGWKHVKAQLIAKIDDLQSIMNITEEDPTKVIMDIKVRKVVMEILMEWMADVEGQTNQYEANDLPPDESEFRHIERTDEE